MSSLNATTTYATMMMFAETMAEMADFAVEPVYRAFKNSSASGVGADDAKMESKRGVKRSLPSKTYLRVVKYVVIGTKATRRAKRMSLPRT